MQKECREISFIYVNYIICTRIVQIFQSGHYMYNSMWYVEWIQYHDTEIFWNMSLRHSYGAIELVHYLFKWWICIWWLQHIPWTSDVSSARRPTGTYFMAILVKYFCSRIWTRNCRLQYISHFVQAPIFVDSFDVYTRDLHGYCSDTHNYHRVITQLPAKFMLP